MRAVMLRNEQNSFSAAVENIDPPEARDGNATLEIAYSSLNYKDALAISNRPGVVRTWPMIAGIDGAGRVRTPGASGLEPGTPTVVTGWGLGETRWGCFADNASVEAKWPVQLPTSLSMRDSMALGTAGLTAMLCIMAIEQHGVKPTDGPVLVTGAAGGVGGISLMLLKKLGYEAVASTGRLEEEDYLTSLGASQVIDRNELSSPGKPLQKERWAAVVDSVGSVTLANACASTCYGGIVAACGLAQGMDFPSSVAPFILRGITLAGVDSVMARPQLRASAWERLAELYDKNALEWIVQEVDLADVVDCAGELMAGRIRGRLVVRVNPDLN